jgi:NOL1/NOP2/fmu family ribosome biogenesis protein
MDWWDIPTDVAFEQTCRLVLGDATVTAWPSDVPSWTESVAAFGPELAHRTGATWKPSHAAARLRRGQQPPLRIVDASDDLARQFLTGEAIPCSTRGWAVVRWRGRPLGWIKGNGTIGKNHLPVPCRL